MARVAGSVRALCCAALFVFALGAHADPTKLDSADFLIPVTTIFGGPSTTPAGESTGFAKLVNPADLAAFGNDLYVADQGNGTLFRIDVVTQRFHALARVPLAGRVRIRTGPDGSVYVLRPDRSEILRMTPGGRALLRYGDIAVVPRPIDLVLEPLQRRIWVLDASGGLYEFMPTGRLLHQIGDTEREPLITMFAPGPRQLLSLDASCHCILRLNADGFVVARFGIGSVRLPTTAEIDRYGRLWVVDAADGLIKIFANESLIGSIRPISLGMAQVSALTFDHDRAYMADGAGGRILAFALLAPGESAR